MYSSDILIVHHGGMTLWCKIRHLHFNWYEHFAMGYEGLVQYGERLPRL